MVERFSRTLKAMLQKHAVNFGNQWDHHLPNMLWAYRNMPHESTGEKSFLFGWDQQTPTEAAFLYPFHLGSIPPNPLTAKNYQTEVIKSLTLVHKLAIDSIARAQK